MTESDDPLSHIIRLLVAEDDAEMRSLLKKVLDREGYAVTAACDGQEAVHLLRGGTSYDVLITDVRMPEKDGIELLCEARQIDPRLKVILITAFGDLQQYLEVKRQGAFEYLTKPFKIPDLLDVVERAIATSNGSQSNGATDHPTA